MATSLGRVYLSGCNYELAYDLLSQDTATNSSSVRLYGILHVTNNYISWSSGSASVYNSGLQSISTYYSRGDHTLITRDYTFTHDNNGNFSSYIGASLSTTFVSGDCGGTMTLPQIRRYPILTSGTNFTDEENPVYTITAFGTYPIRVKIEVGYQFQLITRDLDTRNSTTYTLELTNEERETLRTLATGKTLELYETVCAMEGTTELSVSAKKYTMTIVNGNPTFSAAYEDTNSTTLAITNNNQQIIRNNSTLAINLTNLTALKHSTLSSAKAIIDGTTYNGTISGSSCTINVGTLNLSNNTTAEVVVTDSRGFNTTQELPLTILDWQLPTGIITLERQSNYYSETDIKVDGSYSSLDSKNQMTIKTRYKKTTDQTYGAYTTLQDNVTSTLTLDNLYSWDVQVLIEDLIGSTTYNLSLGIGLPIFFIDRLKRSIGIECFPSDNNSLEVLGINILNSINEIKYDLITGGSAIKTGRKIDGKDEYIKRIECNNLGASGVEKEYATGIDVPNSIITDINVTGFAGSGNWFPFPNNDAGNSKVVLKYTGDLGITIYNQYWENGKAYADIKYIAKQ